MKWSVVPVVSGVCVRPVVKQQTHHLHRNIRTPYNKGIRRKNTISRVEVGGGARYLGVAKGAGVVEGYQPSVVSGVDVGSVLEEEVHNVFTTKT